MKSRQSSVFCPLQKQSHKLYRNIVVVVMTVGAYALELESL